MHPNPIFRTEPRARALEFARRRGFGTLVAGGPAGVLVAHVPFVLENACIGAHLVRANPVAQRLQDGPVSAVLIVSGPDGYVSPDWYGTPGKLPTWNYVAVHLRGKLRRLDDAALHGHLDRLAAQFEERLAPKPAWTTDAIDSDVLAQLMREIAPVAMSIEVVDSTFKLNQNRRGEERTAAATALAAGGTPGMETRLLADLMRSSDDVPA